MLSVVPATAAEAPRRQDPNADVAKLVLHLDQVARPVRLAVLLSPDWTACATPELPSALRNPPSEWVQPGGRTRHR